MSNDDSDDGNNFEARDSMDDPSDMKSKKRNRAVSLSVDWDNIVKLQNEGKKVLRAGTVEFERPTENFCTGSSYTGRWNALGMSGVGTYVFPHGAEYEGYMEDGMFHGEGTLSYPMGQKIDGVWVKGKMVSFKFRYPDGLEYQEPWKYCKMPDRRFYISTREGLQPGGKEFLTNEQPTRTIPEGCYDTGDGFYNPKTKCVTSATDALKVLRKIGRADDDDEDEDEESISAVNDLLGGPDSEAENEKYWSKFICIPTKKEEEWIINNCRKAWDAPSGYRPDLYEKWITGRKDELDGLDQFFGRKTSSELNFQQDHIAFLMGPKTDDADSVACLELNKPSDIVANKDDD